MSNYVCAVGDQMPSDPNEPVMDLLLQQYKRVIMESLTTSFGLDFLVQDQYGGDVDTIHNVRQVGRVPEMTYKNARNAAAYENHGKYDTNEYHRHPRYKEINRQISQQKKDGTLRDAYTGDKIARNGKTDLDHVISAHEIHDDRGRVLSGIKGTDLANCEENLKATTPHINRTKKDKTMDQLLERRGDEYSDKQKENMRKVDAAARKDYNAKLAAAYYTSPRFAKDLTLAAANVGLRMGMRQALGFVFAEMWFAVEEEFQACDVQDGPFDLGDFLGRIGHGIQRGFENAKQKFPDLFSKFLSGATAGVLASLTTTLCNIFFTTAKNVVRVIRQSYASVVEACKVLLINPDAYPFGERMRATAQILATGASVVVGVLVQEALTDLPLGTLPLAGDTVPMFCGTFVTGIMSCTLLYFLNRSEMVNKLVSSLNQIDTVEGDIAYYRNQARFFEEYAARLKQIDLESFRKETAIYHNIAETIDRTQGEEELNAILKQAYLSYGLPLPWKNYHSFDEAMQDPHMRLVFE